MDAWEWDKSFTAKPHQMNRKSRTTGPHFFSQSLLEVGVCDGCGEWKRENIRNKSSRQVSH